MIIAYSANILIYFTIVTYRINKGFMVPGTIYPQKIEETVNNFVL